jgi:hypothetical protein
MEAMFVSSAVLPEPSMNVFTCKGPLLYEVVKRPRFHVQALGAITATRRQVRHIVTLLLNAFAGPLST